MSSFPLNTIYLDSVDSTNTYAKALLKAGEPLKPYTLIYAKEQTAGRGRLGRQWHSKEGDSLCMSLIVPYPYKEGLTLLCALGVHKALQNLCKERLLIKWPNDLIAQNKKLCGILTESTDKAAVIGIGINLNSVDFPEDIAYKATSLKLLTGSSFDPEELAKHVAESVFETIDKTKGSLTEDTIKDYTLLCANIGAEVHFGDKKGVVEALSDDGSLIVKTAGGTEAVRFGEVTVSGIY